jgi:GR25 family glycosyltransferase involved in LPS biosynthesis
MTLNKIFNKIYCINLDRRLDRWSLVSDEFKKINCDVVRFSAVDGNIIKKPNDNNHINDAEFGCLMSHYKILKDIISSDGDLFLILEDDVVFKDNFNELFLQFYNQLPNDWDMVYISGNNTKPIEKITDNIYKTNSTLALHSYFIKKETAVKLKKLIEAAPVLLPIDTLYIQYQKTANVYVFRPHLTKQRPGYSDLRGGFRNYDGVLDI